MKNLILNRNTARVGLRFLLAPEDSSAAPYTPCLLGKITSWDWAKTLFWLVFSVLTAMLVGQL